MYLTHITITMPKGGEHLAREFYCRILGLREITRPERLPSRGGVCFEVGGLELHLSAEEDGAGVDGQCHFGLGCGDVDGLKARVQTAGIAIEHGPSARRKCFFVHDPFGNRIEIQAPRGLRAGG
jgi:catechol 2,3-dioxygenase-like lactoylglutathione lyase family enzyme